MKHNSQIKIVFRRIWGWKEKSTSLLQTAPHVPPLLPAKLIQLAQSNVETVLEQLNTSSEGLSELQSNLRLGKIGLNEIAHEKPRKWYVQFLKTFQNPLVILLMTLAVIALLTEDIKAAVIILSMVVFSVVLRFSQEFRSSQAAEKLRAMVHTTATVCRKDPRKDISPSLAQDLGLTLNLDVPAQQDIPIKFLVPGDVIFLAAGDMIPADVRLIAAKDLFVSQGALTGESLPVEKQLALPNDQLHIQNPLELANLCFLGTSVISGTGTAVVIETGGNTYLGSLAKTVVAHRTATSFDKGVNEVSFLLLRFMLVMVPVVFLINGFIKGNWTEAFFFALSVAVGLTPEMLPMIVTANLARGAIAMSDKKVIVKNIDAIQNFGAMDILCTDKTGTLTQDKIVLEMHLDIYGEESKEVLEFAFLNSFYQTGLKNLLDVAVLEHIDLHESLKLEHKFRKIDEIPFDFIRRRMSVVVEEENHHHELICTGAVEEILQVCTQVKVNGQILPVDAAIREQATQLNQDLNEDGLRVIAVAYKELPLDQSSYSVIDEHNLILIGLIAFLDPPKDSAAHAIAALNQGGVQVKVLTGDNPIIARKTCKDVGLCVKNTLLGSEIEALS
ncbi:MAG: magnesium-translocating P-type ATPase, partial [Methylobacter sp.]